MARGRFIVLEGGEGAGKSTQARLLAEFLEAMGIETVVTREPGGTPFAETVRAKLLSGEHAASGPDAEAILVTAGRIDHLDAVIRPALAAGKWVICDRFTDSTLCYQGTLSGGDPGFIRGLIEKSVGDTRPDLTLLIDIAPEVAFERLSARGWAGGNAARWDDASGRDFGTLRAAFLALAEADPKSHRVIDGSGDAATVANLIRAAVSAALDPKAA